MGRKPEGKAENMFKNLGKKIDSMLADLDHVKDKAKEEYADEIQELKRNGNKLKDELHGLKEKHQDKLDNIEEKIKTTASDIERRVKAMFDKD